MLYIPQLDVDKVTWRYMFFFLGGGCSYKNTHTPWAATFEVLGDALGLATQ